MSDKSFLLTCIIPFHNVAEFVDGLAYSLFHQRMDWVEFIFVDDCSTDGSGAQIAQAITSHKVAAAKIITLEKNIGPSGARNAGLDAARGEYIWFIDSDDLINPSAWVTIKHLLQSGLDVVLLESVYTWISESEKLVQVISPHSSATNPALELIRERTLRTKPHRRTMAARRVLRREDGVFANIMADRMFYTWSIVAKRALYSDIRFPVGKLIEDASTLPKVFLSAETFYYIDIPFVYYRQRENSLLGSRGRQLALDVSGCMRYVKDYIMERSIALSAAEKLELDALHLQTIAWAVGDYARLGLMNDPEAMDVLEANIEYFKATSDSSGKKALAHLKELGRTTEYTAMRMSLGDIRRYFRLRNIYAKVGKPRFIRKLLFR